MTDVEPLRWRPLDLVEVTTPYFQKHGVDSPRLAAELLLAHALGWKRLDLYTRFETRLTPDQIAAFRDLVRRRGRREPIQQILGKTEFCSLEFRCDRRALIPRPETECLVEEAVRRCDGMATPCIADVGTGGGCIAVSLAAAMPNARIAATDISLDALELALANAEAHHVADRIRFLEGDLAAPLLAEGYAGRLDLVVSNPPYVASGEYDSLPPEVRDWEPRLALDGGADGLVFYRRFFAEVRPLLRPGGAAVVELAEDGADSVRALAEAAGWVNVSLREDHAGIRRVLAADGVLATSAERRQAWKPCV